MTKCEIRDTLRQMLAVLEGERQALAGMDLDGIVGISRSKDHLCGFLEDVGVVELDDDAQGMLESARQLNEVNRQVRNIMAANVARRLDALTGRPQIYRLSAGHVAASANCLKRS